MKRIKAWAVVDKTGEIVGEEYPLIYRKRRSAYFAKVSSQRVIPVEIVPLRDMKEK